LASRSASCRVRRWSCQYTFVVRRLAYWALCSLLPAPKAAVRRQPCVVMFVLNDVRFDTRVRKQADAVARLGAQVHVVALDRGNAPVREFLPWFTIHRVRPMPTRWGALLPLLVACSLLPYLPRDAREGPSLRIRLTRLMAGLVPAPWRTNRVLIASWGGGSSAFNLIIGAVESVFRNLFHSLRQLVLLAFRLGRSATRVASGALQALARGVVRMACTIPLFGDVFRRLAMAVSSIGRRVCGRLMVSTRDALGFVVPRSLGIHGINLQMARCAARFRPDVVVSHDCNTLVAGIAMKGRFGCSLVYDSHELYLERNIKAKSRRLDQLQWAPVEALGIRMADRVTTVAEGIARHLERKYRRRSVEVVRNTPPLAAPVPAVGELRRSLGIAPNKAVVMYCGAVTFNRGLDELVAAAAVLRNAVVVIVGPASQPAYLETLRSRASELGVLGSTLHFLEPVPPDFVPQLLAECDFTVVPTIAVCRSYQFEASNKIFASIMAGKPVVMTDHAEKRMLQQRYSIGCLVPEGDVGALAEAIDSLAADRARLADWSANCLRAARDLHWGADLARLELVFRPLLRRSSSVCAVTEAAAADRGSRPAGSVTSAPGAAALASANPAIRIQ
jgi:glycosyltransferase involved in cell wall biosynthesis